MTRAGGGATLCGVSQSWFVVSLHCRGKRSTAANGRSCASTPKGRSLDNSSCDLHDAPLSCCDLWGRSLVAPMMALKGVELGWQQYRLV